MESIFALLGVLVGFGIGYFIADRKQAKKIKEAVDRANELEKVRILLDNRVRAFEAAKKEAAKTATVHASPVEEVANTESIAETFKKVADEILQQSTAKLVEANLTPLQGVIETLKQKMEEFEKKTETQSQTQTTTFQQLIAPFKDQITEFQKILEESRGNDAQERVALKDEIRMLTQLNQRVEEQAGNLTRAIQGETFTRGSWGEFVLETILEQSGLREGEEYTRQGKHLTVVGENEKDKEPQIADITINLPGEKHLVIDSRVPLLAYQQFIGEKDENKRKIHLAALVQAMESHIQHLNNKHYQSLTKLSSPDFVMMFIPVEPALGIALLGDRDLIQSAWTKRISIVTPTTLFATLRTVASLWVLERQNRNAVEIAIHAGLLYDKVASFVKDMQIVGTKLADAQSAYGSSMGKLREGQGSILSKIDLIRNLGSNSDMRLPSELDEIEYKKKTGT